MQIAPWKNITAMPLKAPTNTLIFQQRWSIRSIFLTFLLHRSYKVCGLQFFHIHGSFVLANLEITFECLQVLPCEIFRRQLRILLKCAFSISISKLFNRERKRERSLISLMRFRIAFLLLYRPSKRVALMINLSSSPRFIYLCQSSFIDCLPQHKVGGDSGLQVRYCSLKCSCKRQNGTIVHK